MKLRTWKYYIEQGFKGIAKNGLMSLASIIIVSACAFIVILSLCIVVNIDYMLKQVESNVGITLYMGSLPTDDEVMELKAKIENMDHVINVQYKSADEALESFAELNNMDLAGLKDDNPLPRTLIVNIDDIKSQRAFLAEIKNLQWEFEEQLLGIDKEELQQTSEKPSQTTTQVTTQATTQTETHTAKEPQTQAATQAQVNAPATQTQTATQTQVTTVKEPVSQATTLPVKNEAEPPAATSAQMPEIISQATTEAPVTGDAVLGDADYKFKGIESIQHAQQITDTLVTIDAIFKIVAMAIIAVLCIVAIGIIMNTIKLTVFIRKNEINIMKYVGATDWFIRWPFIIEGVVIGIIGAAIPTVLCWIGYLKLYDMYIENSLLTAIGMQLRNGNEIFAIIAPITIGVGILLGAIGSINSIRKHLNV